MEKSEYVHKQIQNCLEGARRGNYLYCLLWSVSGTMVRIPKYSLELVWFELSTSTKGKRIQAFLPVFLRIGQKGKRKC